MWWKQKKVFEMLSRAQQEEEKRSLHNTLFDQASEHTSKLTGHLLLQPQQTPSVCLILLQDLKKKVLSRNRSSRVGRLQGDVKILQEIFLKLQKNQSSSREVVEMYLCQGGELLLARLSDAPIAHLARSFFRFISDHCHSEQVLRLSSLVIEKTVTELQMSLELSSNGEEENLVSSRLDLLYEAIRQLISVPDRLRNHVGQLIPFLYPYLSNKTVFISTSNKNTAHKCLNVLCSNPSPFAFISAVSALFLEFDKVQWSPDRSIEDLLEILIFVACNKFPYLPQISSALITHARNKIEQICFVPRADKTCFFIPRLERARSFLSSGSELCIRNFRSKCVIIRRMLRFALNCLHFENSFHSNHPCRCLHDDDWNNLLGIVLCCASNGNGERAQIQQSSLSEGIHKNAAALSHMFREESHLEEEDTGGVISKILHLVLECMQQIVSSPTSSHYRCVSSLALKRTLTSLSINDSSITSQTGSVLSRYIRALILFYLTATLEFVAKSRGKSRVSNMELSLQHSSGSLLQELSSSQLCQICVYCRSSDRSTQHLAGKSLLCIIGLEPKLSEDVSSNLSSSMRAHGGMLEIQLIRNTIFNILARCDISSAQHTLGVILAWDLQKKLIENYSIVEVLSAIPMIFALESFWNVLKDNESDSVADLNHENIHSIIIFVCSFFRYVDDHFHFHGALVKRIDLFGHLERYDGALLIENDHLHAKKKFRPVRSSGYQCPKPLNEDAIIDCLVENGLLPLAPEHERARVRHQLTKAVYTPVEMPCQIVSRVDESRVIMPSQDSDRQSMVDKDTPKDALSSSKTPSNEPDACDYEKLVLPSLKSLLLETRGLASQEVVI